MPQEQKKPSVAMRWVRWALVLVLSLAACLFVVLPAAEKVFRQQPKGSTISIGYLPHHGFAPLFVALENGYFAKRGLTVNAVRFDASPPMGTAFVTGDLDAVPISTSVALSIESRDPGRYKVFAVSSEDARNYLTALVTLPTRNINRIEDLRGRRVGIFPGPGARVLFGTLFTLHHVDPDSELTLIEMPAPLQIQALVAGQVDALATYEPIATQAVLEHGAVTFLPGAVEREVLQPTQGGLWLVSAELLKSRPDDAEAMILSIYEAIDLIRLNPSSARTALAQYTGISEAVAQAVPLLPFSKVGEIDLLALDKHMLMLHDAGILGQKVPVEPLILTAFRLAPPAHPARR